MATRWEVERAVLDSDLPAPARHLMLTLCVLCDAPTAVIPRKFSPSLTTLARMTGLGRSTIKRELNRLEEQGWLERHRPTVEAARSKGERTAYALLARPRADLAGPTVGPGLGPERAGARPRAGHRPDRIPDLYPDPHARARAGARASEEKIIKNVIKTILETTGKTIDRPWAEKVTAGLTARYPRKPVTYYEAVIRRDPALYLPTPTPPPYRANGAP